MPSITTCAIDCIVPDLAVRALNICKYRFPTDKTLLISHEPSHGDYDNVIIGPLNSIQAYNKFIIFELSKYIDTDYVLIVQWDGYIVHNTAWNNDFLSYDYIGAVWPQHLDAHRVGNGGFSLRSKKLLNAVHHSSFNFIDGMNEDDIICRVNRQFLEDRHGIRFADEQVANTFSYEQTDPIGATFGFHGCWNLWRHEDDNEIIYIINSLPDICLANYSILKTLMSLFLNRRIAPFKHAFKKATKVMEIHYIKNALIYALHFSESDVKSMIFYGRYYMIFDYLLVKLN